MGVVTYTADITPGQAVSWPIPQGMELTIESVLAEVDATAGGDVTPELELADQSGQVIAAVRQSSPIPGGDTGRATWALRLADEGGGGGGALRTTDGGVTVNPTSLLRIGNGILLTNPAAGEADIEVTPYSLGLVRAENGGPFTLIPNNGADLVAGWGAVIDPQGLVQPDGIHFTRSGFYVMGAHAYFKSVDAGGNDQMPTSGGVYYEARGTGGFGVFGAGDSFGSDVFFTTVFGQQFTSVGSPVDLLHITAPASVHMFIQNWLDTHLQLVGATVWAVGPIF